CIGCDGGRVQNPAGLEERAILVEIGEGVAERATDGWDFLYFFWRQIVEILVYRLARIGLVQDPVETRQQHRRKGEVRVGRRIREADFDTLRLGVGRVHGNTTGGRAIARRIGEEDRRLEP